MVIATRELEKTLGDGIKKIEKNLINKKSNRQNSNRAEAEKFFAGCAGEFFFREGNV